MSVGNRKITQGTTEVKYESKWQTLVGRIYCMFRGHKPVYIGHDRYCICCWKKLDK